MSGTTELAWFRSSYSSGSGDDCVEVAACPTTVHVRDSKLTDGPQLVLTPGPWTDFVRHASADAV